MNADPRFARARLRAARPMLEALGLTPGRIVLAAGHLARVRTALDAATDAIIAMHTRNVQRGILLDAAVLAGVPPELGLRVLARLLGALSGQAYRPRFVRLEAVYAALIANPEKVARTLHGCRIATAPADMARFGSGTILLEREAPRGGKRGAGKAIVGS